jgi:cysteinyl-tRNA synthetase
MKLFNTASRQVEEIEPQNAKSTTVYTCGPTVYDYSHIGHWFTYVRTDTLIRTLKTNGQNVNWVMNITDVGHLVSDADEGEDKLEKSAKREGKTAWEIADFYALDFLKDMERLNLSKPSLLVKATGHIKEQIGLIKTLEAKGYTYIIDDGVYYDVSKFPKYSKFAQLDLDEQQPGARVNYNPQKRNTADFALWKFSPKGHKRDMEWESPWGIGFPGWHIECSAMSMKYLGDSLDIHTGGIDHIAVHHTNEIAQSEAATGKTYAKHWMHSNHVTIEGEKISKSLGNGIRLQDIIDKGFSPMALRLHILESHYRSQSKFTWESLEAANNRLKDFQAMAVLRFQPRRVATDSGTFALENVTEQIKVCLDNDLDTPQAMFVLSQVCTQLLTVHIEEDMVDHIENMLKGLDSILGLNLMLEPDINDKQKSLIKRRNKARLDKDWLQSDQLREELTAQGIAVRDHVHGPIWFRV